MGKATEKTEEIKPVEEVKPVEEIKPDAPLNADTTENAATNEKADDNPADEPLVKSGCRKIRIADFRGSFGNAQFDDNCTAEVDDATVELLRKHFPDCEIEELD